jgi:hypothetical protein
VEKIAKTNIVNNTRKLEAHRKRGKENPIRRADGVTFFGPLRPAASPASSPPSSAADDNEASQANKDDTADSCPLSRDTLKVEIRKPIKPRQSSKSAAANINPPAVEALVDYLLELVPKRFESDSNIIVATDPQSKAMRQLEWHRTKFPPGTLDFTAPRDSKTWRSLIVHMRRLKV